MTLLRVVKHEQDLVIVHVCRNNKRNSAIFSTLSPSLGYFVVHLFQPQHVTVENLDLCGVTDVMDRQTDRQTIT